MRFVITGANGFIGSYLVRFLRKQGHDVVEWVREPKSDDQVSYNLINPNQVPDLKNIDVLIHTAFVAYDKRQQPNALAININGTLALEQRCIEHGVQFIFLSSLSAHEQAVSKYGQQKLTIEHRLSPNQVLVLKLGLVIGNGGLFKRMVDTILRVPILPLPDGGRQAMQIVAISDVAKTILKCAQENTTGCYLLANPKGYIIKDIYTAIALHFQRKLWLINFPIGALYPVVYTAEKLSFNTGITTENLKGLTQSKYRDPSADLKKLGVTLLDLKEAMLEINH